MMNLRRMMLIQTKEHKLILIQLDLQYHTDGTRVAERKKPEIASDYLISVINHTLLPTT